MSDNAPTLRLPTTPPPAPPGVPPPAPPGRPSRGPLVLFILLSVLVVVAIGVLVWVLIGRANASTQAVNSPSTSDTSAPPVSPSQPPPPGVFTVFTVPDSQQCRGHGGPGKQQQPVEAQVTWATTNATLVWVAEGTTDAASVGKDQVPLSGNQDAFPDPLPIDCESKSATFTITLVGADGAHVSRTWTVLIEGRHG
ncbi:MAG: hypothetical protein QOD50_836 [Actinomycetota bacterium]|nr:hypothetical protein [Actinomycetota bacterium]